jgi:hypothetical protein
MGPLRSHERGFPAGDRTGRDSRRSAGRGAPRGRIPSIRRTILGWHRRHTALIPLEEEIGVTVAPTAATAGTAVPGTLVIDGAAAGVTNTPFAYTFRTHVKNASAGGHVLLGRALERSICSWIVFVHATSRSRCAYSGRPTCRLPQPLSALCHPTRSCFCSSGRQRSRDVCRRLVGAVSAGEADAATRWFVVSVRGGRGASALTRPPLVPPTSRP